jgi:inhibitor of cysteine peptidase
MISVSDTDNGKHLDLKLGEVLSIVLPENATTGYVWELADPDASLFSLSNKGSRYTEGTIGAAGQAWFVIRADKTGTGEIRLIHRRPWQDANTALATFTLSVRVQP